MSLDFFEEFITYLKPEQRVLDLGAGKGEQALRMAELGCQVVAVDRNPGTLTHPNITWRIQTIGDWVQNSGDAKFDAVLMKNVLQFITRDWVTTTLFPTLMPLLNPGAVIGIETFYQPPEPPFAISSCWTADELVTLLNNFCAILQKQQTEKIGPDLRGTTRHFYLTQILAQKS